MEYYLVLSTIMMFVGIYGFVTRRNLLAMLISVELILSSVDINFDAHYVFRIADWWGVYPQVGVVANDIKDWAFGMSVGGGFDFNVARRWNISAGLKYEPMFDSGRSNPLVVFVGAAYRF